MNPYISNTPFQIEEMLGKVKISSIEELFDCIPQDLKIKGSLNLPKSKSEIELKEFVANINKLDKGINDSISFLGAGCYNHFVPSLVNHLSYRSEFYTSYTPYQAEVSQGILQSFFEYQTLICNLTGMDISNASLYDGATALVEAIRIAIAVNKKSDLVISKAVHPEYIDVIRTYFTSDELNLKIINVEDGVTNRKDLLDSIDENTSAVVIQNPNFFGSVEDLTKIAGITQKTGALLIGVFDPISLGILKSPGEYDADIAVAEGQSLGNYPYWGGGNIGVFACKDKYLRRIPGRLVGETVDKEGKRGFVLTLQTREQHIRRESATSNICTNQALNALRAAIYLTVLGPEGLSKVALICLERAEYAKKRLSSLKGYELKFHQPTFKEFVLKCPRDANEIFEELSKKNCFPGVPLGKFYEELKDCLLVCVTEMNSKEEIDRLVDLLKEF